MNSADAIVEVTIHYFKKGQKCFAGELEDLVGLGKPTWEEASSEIPEAERGPKENLVGQFILDQQPDTVFNQDWIGFAFHWLGEGANDWHCGVDYIVENLGLEETFEPFRDDLLKLAPAPIGHQTFVRFLTAFSYWGHTRHSYDGDDYEDGIELVGRLDMGNVNVLTPERIAEMNAAATRKATGKTGLLRSNQV